jgi:5-methylcytosine-specific restriction protein A
MSRKQFIQSHGATCRNWTWSWSFINEAERLVIFGAFDVNQAGSKVLIFSEEWQISRGGRRQPAYAQSREHIRLVEEEGYRLLIFPMLYSKAKEQGGVGPASIGGFSPHLTEKSLLRVKPNWYASDESTALLLPEELDPALPLVEGAFKQIRVNAYERNALAREKCLQRYGYLCSVCQFDFARTFGQLGKDFIHVHHIVPISEIKSEYTVDPVKDLVPVCPNCHAMIHRTNPPLLVSQLTDLLRNVSAENLA